MANRRFSFLPIVLILIISTIYGCNRTKEAENAENSDQVFIPAGPFLMGNSKESSLSDQAPVHQVYLDAYYIDKYEVTVREYERFIIANGYRKRKFWTKEGWDYIQQNQVQGYLSTGHPYAVGVNHKLYSGPNQPVIGISWYEADAYCRWAGRRLPTEAEWEKAARGQEGFLYPWGNEMNFANISHLVTNGKRTIPVGSLSGGASPYSVMDMAGNVWEWCSDWYDESYYSRSPPQNPQGPTTGAYRILRGGSWGSTRLQLQSTYRSYNNPVHKDFNIGFRCAKDAN